MPDGWMRTLMRRGAQLGNTEFVVLTLIIKRRFCPGALHDFEAFSETLPTIGAIKAIADELILIKNCATANADVEPALAEIINNRQLCCNANGMAQCHLYHSKTNSNALRLHRERTGKRNWIAIHALTGEIVFSQPNGIVSQSFRQACLLQLLIDGNTVFGGRRRVIEGQPSKLHVFISLSFRLCIALAFVGALVILRPGLRPLTDGHLAMIFAAILLAFSYLTAKRVAHEVSASVIVAMLSIAVTVGLIPFAIAVWRWPSLTEAGWMMVVAVLATAGHYTMTRAFAAAPVSVTQPATFLQLVWSVALGIIVFGEAADAWVILGGIIIVGAATFIAIREAMLSRAQPATTLSKGES